VAGNDTGAFGTGGCICIKAGCNSSTCGYGGHIYIGAGNGAGPYNGGSLFLCSGQGGGDIGADGGLVYICSNIGDSSCGSGGNICIAGAYGYGATCRGSNIYIKPGGAAGGTTYYGCVALYYGTALKFITCNTGACVYGTLGQSSDCRIKKNFAPIINALSIVNCLCGQCFELCDTGEQTLGLVAQDVENVLPRVVSQGTIDEDNEEEMAKYGIEDGMYGLNYNGFIPVLIEGMKEQQKQINALKAEIEILKGN